MEGPDKNGTAILKYSTIQDSHNASNWKALKSIKLGPPGGIEKYLVLVNESVYTPHNPHSLFIAENHGFGWSDGRIHLGSLEKKVKTWFWEGLPNQKANFATLHPKFGNCWLSTNKAGNYDSIQCIQKKIALPKSSNRAYNQQIFTSFQYSSNESLNYFDGKQIWQYRCRYTNQKENCYWSPRTFENSDHPDKIRITRRNQGQVFIAQDKLIIEDVWSRIEIHPNKMAMPKKQLPMTTSLSKIKGKGAIQVKNHQDLHFQFRQRFNIQGRSK